MKPQTERLFLSAVVIGYAALAYAAGYFIKTTEAIGIATTILSLLGMLIGFVFSYSFKLTLFPAKWNGLLGITSLMALGSAAFISSTSIPTFVMMRPIFVLYFLSLVGVLVWEIYSNQKYRE